MRNNYLALFIAFLMYQNCQAQSVGNSDISWFVDTKESFILDEPGQILGLAKLTNEGKDFSGKHIYLSGDIYLSQYEWLPIGTPENPFKGTFDGCLHRVEIGKIHTGDFAGFFGYVANATIQNVSVSCTEPISDCQTVGAVVAYADGKTTLSYCQHIDSLVVVGARVVGGISANCDAYLLGCSNKGAVILDDKSYSFVGGLVGTGAPTIVNCNNISPVSGGVTTGGIIGKLNNTDENVLFTNTYNKSSVSIHCSSENPAYQYSVGGIAGIAPWIIMSSCWNEGKVSISCYKDNANSAIVNSYAGGLVGEGAGKFKYCYNVGEVFVRNVMNAEASVGRVNCLASGILAMNTEKGITEIDYCYNAGKILAFGQAPIKVALKYGGIIADFASFMPKMNGAYSLEGCCGGLDSNGSMVSNTLNNAEKEVSKDEMCSESFLIPVKSTITLNNDLVYLYDSANNNNGFPVLKTVDTALPEKVDNGSVLLKGNSLMSGKKYFRYWLTGMEEYAVDVEADSDFSYNIGKAAVGEHNVKAYVVIPHANIRFEGDVIMFHIK